MATLVCLSTTNWINIFCNLDKYCLQSGQIHFAIWTNTFCHLDKYILQSGQIHFAIRTNTFCNLDKYFLQFRQLRLLIASYQILPGRESCYVFYTYILNCYNCTAQCTGLEQKIYLCKGQLFALQICIKKTGKLYRATHSGPWMYKCHFCNLILALKLKIFA